MKHLLAFIALTLVLTGCASLNEPKLLQPLTKVALVSVVSNDQLYFRGDKPPQPSVANGLLSQQTNQGNSNALLNTVLEKTDGLLAKGDELLTTALGSARGVTLTTKDDLFASKVYQGAWDDKLGGMVLLTPVGYRFVKADDPNLASGLAKQLGVNGLFTANFLFQKEVTLGVADNGSMGARTTLTITAHDATGRLVFRQVYLGQSKDTELLVAGVYDPQKFQVLGEQATKAAVDKFATDLAAH